MENVKKFYEVLASDEAMRKRAEALNEQYKGGKPDDAAVRADIVAFAKREGYEFAPEELDAYAREARPLSDDELEAVAGGYYVYEECFCVLGGGGKDPDTGKTCACVFGGGGKKDKTGQYLACAGAGFIFPYAVGQ